MCAGGVVWGFRCNRALVRPAAGRSCATARLGSGNHMVPGLACCGSRLDAVVADSRCSSRPPDNKPSAAALCVHLSPVMFPAAAARACTPTQLAALAEVLHMSVPATHQLLERCPQLQQQPPALLRQAVQQLADQLSIPYKDAAYMAARQPQTLLLQPAEQAAAAAAALATALSVPTVAVIAAAVTVPSMLAGQPLSPRALCVRLQHICSIFAVKPAAALQMVAVAPELLTDSLSGQQRRLQALWAIFKLQPVSAQRLAAAYPCALFLSPRILNNKLKVLMAILQRDQRAVGQIVYKTPQLLRLNLERVRVCYQLLPLLVQRGQDFVFAMAAHQGRLLLLPPPKLLLRGARMAAVLLMVPSWQQQWQQWRPPAVEHAYASHTSRFDRLEFLLVTQQAGSISLHDAFFMPSKAFQQQYPAWPAWYVAAQQQRREQQQQRHAAQEQQRQKQLEQQQQRQRHLEQQQQLLGREQVLDRLWLQQQQQQHKLGHSLPVLPSQPSAPDAAASSSSSSSGGARGELEPSGSVASRSAQAAFAAVPLTGPQQQVRVEYQRVLRQQLRLLQEQHKQRQLQWQQHRFQKQQQKALQLLQQRQRPLGAKGSRQHPVRQHWQHLPHPAGHQQQQAQQPHQLLPLQAQQAEQGWQQPQQQQRRQSQHSDADSSSSGGPQQQQLQGSIVPLPADQLHWPQQQQYQQQQQGPAWDLPGQQHWQQQGSALLQQLHASQVQQQQQHLQDAAVPLQMAVAASTVSNGRTLGVLGQHEQLPQQQQLSGRSRAGQHRQRQQRHQEQQVAPPVWHTAAAGAEGW